MAKENNVTVIKRALISVSDKRDIISLAKALFEKNIQVLSTGGTAKLLKSSAIDVKDVSEHTGFPEIMQGRVKTLHPKIAGGILGRRDIDAKIMQENCIDAIDLVIVNLYPFAATIANPDHTLQDAIENIDIGGPTMIRAAAKNFNDVAIVVDPADYSSILEEIQKLGGISYQTRFKLMKKAFAHTAAYDKMIADYFNPNENAASEYPEKLELHFNKKLDLRYGENPQQTAALYLEQKQNNSAAASAEQLQGKALSFNNIVDADTAWECVKTFEKCACVIVKHANPCGVAIDESVTKAYQKAFQTDPTSAFGGIIAINHNIDEQLAEIMIKPFVEVVIAPNFSESALAIFSKKKNIRLLKAIDTTPQAECLDYKRVNSGLLVQTYDSHVLNKNDLTIVGNRKPEDHEIADLLFAWKVCKFVKSNAIVYAKDGMTVGVGAGQMSRVYSAKIAQIKAADENLFIEGSVMASDAFFPFRDSIDAAAAAGVKAIIQPGGSIRDQEVIDAANEHDIAMVFTGVRHFRH